MDQNKTELLGKGSIGKLLFQLAVPAITAQVVNLLYNMVDRVYIGHMEGTGPLALTGVGVCMPLIMVISAFAALVSMGGAPRASIYLGKGEKDNAEKTLGNCAALQMALSLVLTAVFLLFGDRLLVLFGASENTLPYASAYLRIYSIGTLFVQLTLGMNAFVTAQGFAKISMLTVLIGAVCNIVLDPIFIFVFKMGVSGAALATILSQAVSAAWVMVFLTGKKTTLRLRARNLRLAPHIILPCLALGLSPFIMQFTESVITMCFNASLLKYGGDVAVGSMSILAIVMQFSMMPMMGLSQGAQPIVSYNYGAGSAPRVKKAFNLLLISSVIYSCLLWLAAMLFPQVFVHMFTSDAQLLAFSSHAMRIYMSTAFVFGVQLACQQTFIAIGNAPYSLFLAVLRKVVLLIPLIYLLPAMLPIPKTDAVFLAEPVADVLAVTTTAILFAIQFKKAMRRIEHTPVQGQVDA
ncbi:MAG: MATE family efflux transporter [Eubacteriales bacterium]|nr:MATE family efflux transporter [Eubacteriales bacterium]